MTLSFTVPGTPKGKARARTFAHRGKIVTKTPDATRQYERTIGLMAQANRPEGWPLDRRYALTVLVYGARANTDIDNVGKAVMDACGGKRAKKGRPATPGILFNNDCQIDHLVCRRFASKERPRIEVTLEVLAS